MKICLTVNSSPWANLKGGGNIAVHYLAEALVNHGQEVTVVYSKFPDDVVDEKASYRIAWARHHDVATINLNIFSFRNTFKKLLKDEPFDIVHGNGEESLLVSDICKEQKIPFVYTSHANSLPDKGMMAGMLSPLRFLKSVNQYLQRATALNAKRIITYSKFSSQLVSSALGSQSPPIDVVPPGIDPAWSHVSPDPGPDPVFLLWGRMENQKGVDDLLKAFRNVHRNHPEVKLWIAGEGNLVEQYQRMAKEFDLDESVRFFGWQSVEALRELVSKATACVFPSRVESFGLAIAEALATGVPVITTSVGALPELIDSGKTGTLVPVNDVPALTQAMEAVLKDPGIFLAQAEQGRKSVLERYSWSRAAERMSTIYQALKS